MLQQAFPPTQIEKDVMLGVLPFHHIFGMPTDISLFGSEAEKFHFRGSNVTPFCGFDWVTGCDNVTA